MTKTPPKLPAQVQKEEKAVEKKDSSAAGPTQSNSGDLVQDARFEASERFAEYTKCGYVAILDHFERFLVRKEAPEHKDAVAVQALIDALNQAVAESKVVLGKLRAATMEECEVKALRITRPVPLYVSGGTSSAVPGQIFSAAVHGPIFKQVYDQLRRSAPDAFELVYE